MSAPAALDPRSALQRATLRFGDPTLEADYLRYRDEEKGGLVMYTFSLGVVLYLGLVLIEWQRMPASAPTWLVPALGLSALPNLVPALAVLFVPALRRRLHLLVPLVMAINGVGHVAAILLAPRFGLSFPYSLLTIQLTFLLLLSGVLLRHAVPLAALTVLGYAAAENISDPTGGHLPEHMFLFGADLLLGSFACYLLERSERVSWLAARRVRELAERDQLTSLYNRRHLDEHGPHLLRQARRENKPTSALFADVDYFKAYNDSLGHHEGDMALEQLATALSTVARRPLDLAARIGGEEFVLLLYDCDLDGAIERAENLRARVQQLALAHPRAPSGRLTISVGVACAPASDVSLTSLLDAADQALYQAKESGRNRVGVYRTPPPPEVPQTLKLF